MNKETEALRVTRCSRPKVIGEKKEKRARSR